MKRKVRITPPSSNPFESNPMSMWMAKMGGAQMSQAQPTEEEHIYSIAAEMLSQGIEQDDVKESLSQNGFSKAKVNELVDSLVAYVDEQRDLSEENYLGDEDEQERLRLEEEAAAREAMEDEALQNEMYYAESDPGYAEEDAAMQDILMKFGGKVPTKKQFVKTSVQLKKKQEGGQEQTNKADDTLSQKRPLSDFVYSVSNEAQAKADEEMFEQEYDNYFGVDNELDEAQWGGTRGERRMMRRANRMMRQIPVGFTPPGQMFPSQLNILNQATLFPLANTLAGQMLTNLPVNTQLANIEVRRTGLFGKPKEYTMNFNTVQPSQVTQQEVADQEKQNVKTTQEEVSQQEKEKETTTAAKDNEKVQEELATTDQVTAGSNTSPKKKASTSAAIAKVDSTTPQVKKDKWGRPEGSKWYGYDPNTNTFTTSAAQPAAMGANPLQNIGTAFTNWNNSPEAAAMVQAQRDKEAKNAAILEAMNPVERYLAELSMKSNNQSKATSAKKDAWGRPEGSEWYGYDPNKSNKSNKSSYLSYIPKGALNAANTAVNATNTAVDQIRRSFQQQGGITGEDLYKFIYGGNEMSPFADESFMYNSKDTTDPYFQTGGNMVELYDKSGKLVNTVTADEARKNKIYDQYTQKDVTGNTTTQSTQSTQNNNMGMMGNMPIYPPLFGGRRFRPPGRAIQYAGSWAQQQGLPFDPRTGKPITGLASSSAPISKIDVTKSSLFGKRPKEYTVYYGNQGTGQAPAGSSKTSDANQSQDQLRQYSGFQNTLAKIPGLSKFVNQPKGDYVPAEGFVSPTTPGSATPAAQQTMLPAPQFTDKELGMDQLVDVQPESFYNTPDNQAMLNNMAPNAPSAPEYSDADLRMNQMVDVQPEDLSQYRSSFYDIDKLPIRRPYTDEQRQTLQDFAPAVNSLNYSADLADQNMDEVQDFDLQRMQAMDRPVDMYSDRIQAPWSNLDFTQQPGVEEEAPANSFLPPARTNVSKSNVPRKNKQVSNQPAVNQNSVNNKNQKKVTPSKNVNKTVFDNAAVLDDKNNESYYEFSDKQDIYTDPETGRQYDRLHPAFKDAKGGFDKNKFDQAVQKGRVANKNEIQQKEVANKKDTERQAKLYKSSGFPTEYVTNPNKMSKWLDSKPEMLYWIMEEPESLYLQGWKTEDIFKIRKNYAKWANQNGIDSKYAKDYSKGTYATKQKGGYLSIAQAGVNINSVNNQDDSEIPMLKPKSSQEVWAVTEPQIRESWGLGEKTDPELQYDPYAVTYKNKNMYNIDPLVALNKTNEGLNKGIAGINALRDRNSQEDFYANLPFQGQMAKQTMNRGDYDANSGLFRPDKMGFEGVAQKGGSTKYKENQSTYMSAKQIADFIANGGEIEFI